MSDFIKSFKDISSTDVKIAGGKGASLGEMTRAGIPVPPGFVVCAGAFDQFLKETDLNVEIDSILHDVNKEEMHTIDRASDKIQALILGKEVPPDIAEEVRKAFDELGAEFVAVRSSATAEDSAIAAWAGQLDSFLNTTEATLLENVKKCWASLFTPRAIFYRFEQNLHSSNISVAVVVQRMVQSEASGIAFSVHPVTEDRNQLIIEAGLGLGEAIVSGQITPDSYVVEKTPRRIIDKNVVMQERGIYRADKGGNEWRDISKEQGEKQVLSDEQILELTDIILNIEKHYGFPCDIEWAMACPERGRREKEQFHIVQSRPITTLGGIEDGHQEYRKIMNRSMFLMSCETWDRGERIELPKICENCITFDPLFVYEQGKGISIYYNFSDPAQGLNHIAEYFKEHENRFDELRKSFDEKCDEIRRMIQSKKVKELEDLFEAIISVWPLITISSIVGNEDEKVFDIKPSLISKFRNVRKESDGVLHWGEEAILELATDKVPGEFEDYVEFLLFDEVLKGNLPDVEELKKRSNGYIYHKGSLYSGEKISSFAKKNKIYIREDEVDLEKNVVKGIPAYGGKVQGKVSVVFERKDIKKVKNNDIFVTPMTTPNLISAMNKASAFVTDEGGITCHASIVAREMKKPCIIGTKIATQVLKDGDLVEVDADRGVVRVLKRYNGGQKKKLINNQSREHSLFYAEVWSRSNLFDIGQYVEENVEDLLFIKKPDSPILDVYYEKDEYQRILNAITKLSFEDENWFTNLTKTHDRLWKELLPYATFEKEVRDIEGLKKFYELWWKWWSTMGTIFVVLLSDAPQEIIDAALEIRGRTEKYSDQGDRVYTEFFQKHFPQYAKYVEVLLPEEVFTLEDGLSAEKIEELERRVVEGFIFHNHVLYPLDELERVLNEHNSELEQVESLPGNRLRGQVVSKGSAVGRVRIIPEKSKVDSLEEGEVLVTHMTSPDYLPAFRKASAVITNEGGVMCHAAITAREFNKPAVVGTRVATQVLKDGDIVEVDADRGVVRVLKNYDSKT